MRINGKPFIVLLGLVTLALFVLTQVLWRRLSRNGPGALAGRIGLLVGSQVALVATLAAIANASFGFYTSWDDLFGTASQAYRLSDHGAVSSSVNATQLVRSAATAGTAPTTGTVTVSTLTGLRSGITARLRIYLPPQYFAPKAARTDFPAIIVDEAGRPDGAALATGLLTGHGPQHPAVVVIVDTADGSALPCMNIPKGPQGELFWAQDLRTAIAFNYRVNLDAGSWGIVGTDAAGACAASLAIADSGRFGAAAALGAWATADSRGVLPELGEATDPATWLHTYPAPPVRLLLDDSAGPVDLTLGGVVRPPLQVQSTTGLAEPAAVDWLSAVLSTGEGARA
jgi:hypothetical protein